ncbi:MAG: fasciclin domain-containing protein [Pseudanabaenaceae cyanobacterium bins.68]|nr:fasciclin domain-containing protein [Pseudanabaenaceae cyanobacterium bins.68]
MRILNSITIATGILTAALIGAAIATTNPVQAETQKLTEKAPAATAKAMTIVDVASGNNSFSTLVQAIKAAGLVETLSGKGPFTVFAPTDQAFAALPKDTLASLLKPENKVKLTRVLTYHVVPGKVMAKDVKAGAVKTVETNPVTIKVSGGKVMVNEANVTQTDITASNGVIHVIDKVILPPNL